MVLIGSEAWVRDTKGWSAVEPDSIRPLAMANVRAILKVGTYIERLKDDGTGPITAGEPTRRYRDTSNMAAENEAQAIDEEIARTSPECIKELERLKKDLAFENLAPGGRERVGWIQAEHLPEQTLHLDNLVTSVG